MPKFDNLPQFFEELKLKEDAIFSLPDLISQFKQQIPLNYLEIKLEEGNYGGSTNPKWKNKPLSERYFFTREGKEIQLDIPHPLLEKLGLEKGADITQPLYLDPKVLERTEVYKGITIENEKEIVLVNPTKIIVKDQEIQTELSSNKIKELKDVLDTLNLVTIARKSQGSWQGFYDWLNKNVFDPTDPNKNHRYLRTDAILKYPFFNRTNGLLAILEGLEKVLGIVNWKNFVGWNNSEIKFFEYNESKKLAELINKTESNWAHIDFSYNNKGNWVEDFNKMFDDYRKQLPKEMTDISQYLDLGEFELNNKLNLGDNVTCYGVNELTRNLHGVKVLSKMIDPIGDDWKISYLYFNKITAEIALWLTNVKKVRVKVDRNAFSICSVTENKRKGNSIYVEGDYLVDNFLSTGEIFY
jgi:hypothetical protein